MKDYDSESRQLEGVTRSFTLRGVEFEAKPAMPGEHLSALADMQTGNSDGRAYEVCTAAIRATLIPSHRETWDQVLAGEYEVPITLKTLMQIADDLVEEATGRPPQPRTPSGSTGENGSTRSTESFASMAGPASSPSSPGPAST